MIMSSQQEKNSATKKVGCWPARIVGIIGLISILWFGAYAVQDFTTDPHMIPLVILWGLMLIGGCVDMVLVGWEGKGGLLITVVGIAAYLYIIAWLPFGWTFEWIIPAIMGTTPLWVAGLMFYSCGKRRKRLRQ